MPTNTPVILTQDQIKALVTAYPKIEPILELKAHSEPNSPIRKICEFIGVMANDLLTQLPKATTTTTTIPPAATTPAATTTTP